MQLRRNGLKHVVQTDPCDVQAQGEGKALNLLGAFCPRRAGSQVTSSIPWSPKKPSGDKGWLAMSESRKMRAALVRGRSNHTPKLKASYMRAFGAPDKRH